MTISLGTRRGLAAKTVPCARRQLRGCKEINGATERPRMVVTRFARRLYVQVIDDTAGRILVSASATEADLHAVKGDKFAKAYKVGGVIIRHAKEAGIEDIVSDCADNKRHGRIAALADTTRKAGLGF